MMSSAPKMSMAKCIKLIEECQQELTKHRMAGHSANVESYGVRLMSLNQLLAKYPSLSANQVKVME